MKHLLGYVIWNKVRMIDWITDGIIESFTPDQVDLLFVLDNPIDGTDVKLKEIIDNKLSNFKCHVNIFPQETYKFPCQNWMLKYAVLNEYKSLIAPQDDQKITDKNLIENIDKIFDKYGENIGVIGLRDGFDFGYKNAVSSSWSESIISTLPRLKNGEISEVELLNDGGIIYPKHTIKKIGMNDVATYKRFYIEDDYCMMANRAALKNILLGNDLIHNKEKASLASSNMDEYASIDLISFIKKWNK